jgi:hypothetical protein
MADGGYELTVLGVQNSALRSPGSKIRNLASALGTSLEIMPLKLLSVT